MYIVNFYKGIDDGSYLHEATLKVCGFKELFRLFEERFNDCYCCVDMEGSKDDLIFPFGRSLYMNLGICKRFMEIEEDISILRVQSEEYFDTLKNDDFLPFA